MGLRADVDAVKAEADTCRKAKGHGRAPCLRRVAASLARPESKATMSYLTMKLNTHARPLPVGCLALRLFKLFSHGSHLAHSPFEAG
jgi:hypothetical protein